MDFRVFVEPQQGASPTPINSPSPERPKLGYSAFFRSDHYVAMSGAGLPGPTDSRVTLGALARETETIRLGTMVTSATFRHPGPLAISVAQVDEMSGGRSISVSARAGSNRSARGLRHPVPAPWASGSTGSPNNSRS